MSDLSVDGFLADSVAAVDGKLYALGAGWNRISVSSFPARHDRIAIGLLLHVGGGDPRRRRFRLRVETPDGSRLALGGGPSGSVDAIDGEFTAGGSGDITVPLAIQLDGLPLQSAGRYAVVVSVDDEDVKTLTFDVQRHAPSPTEEPRRPTTGTGGYL